WKTIAAGLLRVTFSFFTGVLVYRLWSATIQRPIVVPPALVTISLVLILISSLPRFPVAYELLTVLFAFPLIIFLGANSKPFLDIERRSFVVLGLSSYAVYVLQAPFFIALWLILYKLLGPSAEHLSIIGGIVFSAAIFAFALAADY